MLTRIALLAFVACFLTGCGTGVDIWKAVDAEDLPAIQKYAAKRGDLDAGATFYGRTPLLYAIEQNKKQSYKTLLACGANPNTLCLRGRTPIHIAAYKKDSFWLKEALAAGGDPNLVNTNASKAHRGTVLLFSIGSHSVENVAMLVEAGADINAYAHNNQTALTHAIDNLSFDIALYLLDHGADYNKTSTYSESTIFLLIGKVRLSRSGSYKPEQREKIFQIAEFVKKAGLDIEKARFDESAQKWVAQ